MRVRFGRRRFSRERQRGARRVIPDRFDFGNRLQIVAVQFSQRVEPRKITAKVDDISVDRFGVGIVAEIRIVFNDARGGGRFESDDCRTVAHRFAKRRDIFDGEVFRAVEIAQRKGRLPGAVRRREYTRLDPIFL